MFASLFFTVGLAVLASAGPAKRAASVFSSCTNANDVALTFDDGPYLYLKDISDTLTNAGAKGTFFFNGNNYDCIYDSNNIDNIKYAYDAGHQLGSHTWSHADLTTLTWDQINDEMWGVEQALMRIVGARPAFMRPPYGAYNDMVSEVAGDRGQSLVLWDFDSGDSTGASVAESEDAYANIIWNQHPSSILTLNHETYATTAYEVLPYAIQQLQSAGYNLVTVAECLGLEPYQSFNTPETPDSSWTC
ncbi:carbohydrate esterase family 4 protein [Fistulina hepatica ATCC 64428]|nr:carbohydrate esterase family 4 protein [Fistulina hepatica ATCC 64428]